MSRIRLFLRYGKNKYIWGWVFVLSLILVLCYAHKDPGLDYKKAYCSDGEYRVLGDDKIQYRSHSGMIRRWETIVVMDKVLHGSNHPPLWEIDGYRVYIRAKGFNLELNRGRLIKITPIPADWRSVVNYQGKWYGINQKNESLYSEDSLVWAHDGSGYLDWNIVYNNTLLAFQNLGSNETKVWGYRSASGGAVSLCGTDTIFLGSNLIKSIFKWDDYLIVVTDRGISAIAQRNKLFLAGTSTLERIPSLYRRRGKAYVEDNDDRWKEIDMNLIINTFISSSKMVRNFSVMGG